MPRYLTVVSHLPPDELAHRYRQAHDPVARTHWHLLWLLSQGRRVPEAARLVGYTANWARELIRRYNAQGPTGIDDRRQTNPGHPPLLSPALREELRNAVAGPAPDDGLWTGRKVATWMGDRLGRPVSPQRGWEAMRMLGFTPQQPRPRATQADPAAQDAFKKGGSKRPSRRRGRRIPRRSSASGPRTNIGSACCRSCAACGRRGDNAPRPGSGVAISGSMSTRLSDRPPARVGGACSQR